MLSSLLELAIPEDLQIDQANTDSTTPQQQSSSQDIETKIIPRCVGCHCYHLRQTWRPAFASRQKLSTDHRGFSRRVLLNFPIRVHCVNLQRETLRDRDHRQRST